MASNLFLSVRIGVINAGTLRVDIEPARGASLRLGQASDDLAARYARMGAIMARAMAHPSRDLGQLRRQYEQLGQTLEQLRLRQERLTASMARGHVLREERAGLREQAGRTVNTAMAVAAPIVQSVRMAAAYEGQVKDMAIKSDFSPAEEARLGAAMRESALTWSQSASEVARGTALLAAGGIRDARALEQYASVMAKGATGTRASMDDLGKTALGLREHLSIGESGFEGALNMLAYASKRGQFEIGDMAKALPELGPSLRSLGLSGKDAVAELGAGLQIARKGAGSNDAAVANYKSFLQKMTAPDTLKAFEKAGVDLKGSMANLGAEGMSPVQAMVEVTTKYLSSKGPDAAAQFQKAMSLKDDKEREIALQRLAETHKLGELFKDAGAMAFLAPAMANQPEMQSIRGGSVAASENGMLDQDIEKRMAGASAQFDRFRSSVEDLGLSVGTALLPPLVELMNEVRPGIQAFSAWTRENPAMIRGLVGVGSALVACRLAFIGVSYGINLVATPLNALNTGVRSLTGNWTVLRTRMQAGEFPRLAAGIARARSALSTLGGRVSSLSFSGVANGLVGGLRMALPWIGRAAMMLLRLSPIGLALSTVGLVVYKYWQPIKGFFVGLWQGLSSVAGPAIRGLMQSVSQFWRAIGRLAMAIPGVGFAFRAVRAVVRPVLAVIGSGVRAVWDWFKRLLQPVDDVGGKARNMGQRVGEAIGGIIKRIVDLPTRFYKLGGEIVSGLANGIKNDVAAVINTIGSLGDTIAGKFKSVLGIRSPSRVFAGFGENLGQGAAIGIGRSATLAGKAVTGMALATTSAWGTPQLPAPAITGIAAMQATATPPLERARRLNQARAAGPAAATGGAGAGAMVIHFAPQITVQGGDAAAVKGEIHKAMQLSYADFERMMKRYQHDKSRVSHGRSN
ncbi:MAG: phage tail tape measure protein [Duganella sp.]